MLDRILTEIPGFGLLLAVGLLVVWLVLVVFTVWRLTHPPRRTFAGAVARGLPADPGEMSPARAFESWTLKTSDGLDLPVWEVPGDAADGPTGIMCHGWGDSRIGAMLRMPHWLGVCSKLICWDMRGHGEAPGTSAMGTKEVDDLLKLIDEVGAGKPVLLVGWSMGAGVCIEAAAKAPEKVAGVLAEAPYILPHTPARNVMRDSLLPYRSNLAPAMMIVGLKIGRGPFWTGPGTDESPGFDRSIHAKKVQVPLIVLHGEDDTVCPFGDGQAIARQAPKGTLISVEEAGHNNIWLEEQSSETGKDAIRALMDAIGSGEASARSPYHAGDESPEPQPDR